jgi:hypothetical protein
VVVSGGPATGPVDKLSVDTGLRQRCKRQRPDPEDPDRFIDAGEGSGHDLLRVRPRGCACFDARNRVMLFFKIAFFAFVMKVGAASAVEVGCVDAEADGAGDRKASQ